MPNDIAVALTIKKRWLYGVILFTILRDFCLSKGCCVAETR